MIPYNGGEIRDLINAINNIRYIKEGSFITPDEYEDYLTKSVSELQSILERYTQQ